MLAAGAAAADELAAGADVAGIAAAGADAAGKLSITLPPNQVSNWPSWQAAPCTGQSFSKQVLGQHRSRPSGRWRGHKVRPAGHPAAHGHAVLALDQVLRKVGQRRQLETFEAGELTNCCCAR